MHDELNTDGLRDVECASGVPASTVVGRPTVENVEGRATPSESAATRADVELALPRWCLERRRLQQDRIRHRDTTDGDRLVVEFIRVVGPGLAAGIGFLAGWATYSRVGLAGGLAAGVSAFALAFGAASYAAALVAAHFARDDHARRDTVARSEASIRELDKNIFGAFLEHGLVEHSDIRRSF